ELVDKVVHPSTDNYRVRAIGGTSTIWAGAPFPSTRTTSRAAAGCRGPAGRSAAANPQALTRRRWRPPRRDGPPFVRRLALPARSSPHRGGRAIPFDPIDFESRDWVPGSGWPFGRDELAGHYEKAMEASEAGRPAFCPEHALPGAQKELAPGLDGELVQTTIE